VGVQSGATFLIIQPGQENQYAEVEMTEEMRAQVLELCKKAYDKGHADATDKKRLQLAYDNGWRAGYSRGFEVGMRAISNQPIPDEEVKPV
jgi:hypothetical protein